MVFIEILTELAAKAAIMAAMLLIGWAILKISILIYDRRTKK